MFDELLEKSLLDLLNGDAETLDEAVLGYADDLGMDEDTPHLDRAVTFADAGVMTANRGLVLRFTDGTEFQVTLVRSR